MTLASSMTTFDLEGASVVIWVVLPIPLWRILAIEVLYWPERGAACADVRGVMPEFSLIRFRGIFGTPPAEVFDSSVVAGLMAVEETVFQWEAEARPLPLMVTTLLILNFLSPLPVLRPLSGLVCYAAADDASDYNCFCT